MSEEALASSSYGRAARESLETAGLPASIPTIRSSDFSLVNTCRFLYYLKRRLHLASIFAETDSAALRFGSWFHTRLEAIAMSPPAVASFMQKKIAARLDEIAAVCKLYDLSAETRLRIQHDAREDAVTAWMWFEAAATYKNPLYPQLANGFTAYLSQPALTLLGKELTLYYKHPRFPKTFLTAQLDELRFNPETKKLWLVDAKSCSGSPRHRLARVTCEAQPRHYLYICDAMLPLLIDHFKLPADTTIGGIIHVAVQKPSIRLSQGDRPYTLKSEGKKKNMQGTGIPKAGQWACRAWPLDAVAPPNVQPILLATEEEATTWLQDNCGKLPDRLYAGEPSPQLYKNRCIHWYNGTGDYADKKAERDSVDCPTNISTTPYSIMLDTRVMEEYLYQLNRVYEYATCTPDPYRFDRTDDGLRSFDNPTEGVAKFYNLPVSAWPALVQELRLLQSPRDVGLDLRDPSFLSFSKD